MKVTTTNDFDYENEALKMMFQSDDPNEIPRPEEDDGTVEADNDDEDDEDDDGEIIKPYN
ncbi:hypothetical protein [Kordia sp.]|uniref:hypothetical protein n=1 Tax=Kordia sp. TaxID=1965332 RepID=UPI003D6A6120